MLLRRHLVTIIFELKLIFPYRMFYGMYPTLLGPSLPFLANAVNVDIETINWLQPFGKF